MKLSKKLFAAGVVAALTLSVAASALAAELTVKTKKINEGQVKIATPVIAGSEGGVKMDTLLTQMTTKNTVAEIYKYLSSDSQKITLDNYLDFTNGSPDPVKEGFALVKGSAFLVNAGFDKEQKALGKTQAAEKYRLDIDYTAYTVDSEILSLEQYASAYTGGAHDNESITTLTVNPKKAEQFFQTAAALRGQSQVIVETEALEQHTVVIENLDRSLQSGNSFGRDII